jgi:hypothetical protein
MDTELIPGLPNWATALFGGGLVASLSTQVRESVFKLLSHVVVTAELDPSGHQLVLGWLMRHGKVSKFSPAKYLTDARYVRSMRQRRHVAFKSRSTRHAAQLFYVGRVPVWISRDKGDNRWDRVFKIRFIRGTFDLESVLVNQAAKVSDILHGVENDARFAVHHLTGSGYNIASDAGDKDDMERPKSKSSGAREWSEFDQAADQILDVVPLGDYNFEDLHWRPDGASLDDMALSEDVSEVAREIQHWHAHERWYDDRKIPWRLGYCLSGPPGTGKTSFVRGLALQLQMPIYLFDLASFSNADMIKHWGTVKKNTPCIVLLEDIDSVFHGRQNIAATGGFTNPLSFDCLLQCLDGASDSRGVLLFVTSNFPDKLDPAISEQRPGRIDGVVTFGPIDKPGIQKLANRILKDFDVEDIARHVDEIASQGPWTPAQVQRRLHLLALARDGVRAAI